MVACWIRYAVDRVVIKYARILNAVSEECVALAETPDARNIECQLGIAVSLEKPDLASVVLTVPTPTPTMSPSDFPYSYGATAEGAGKVRARGSKGSGRGLPISLVPSARDDGRVVCTRYR